jgi:hypothetical protein
MVLPFESAGCGRRRELREGRHEEFACLVILSSPLGMLAKHSLGVRPITIVDFWSPTRATSAGYGAHLGLPRFATWCKKRAVLFGEIPRKRVTSSPFRFLTGSACSSG